MTDLVDAEDPRRYPLLLDLSGRDVLVVGGGPVAARRVAGLLTAGAQVHVVAPALCEDLTDLVRAGARVSWIPREAIASDVLAGPQALTAEPPAPATEDADSARSLVDAVPGSSRGATDDPHDTPPDPPLNAARGRHADPVPPGLHGGRWWLVHTATGVAEVDQEIAAAADAQGIWCVRADRATASPGHVPAVAHGPDGVQVAVSGGGDPGRARAIRNSISHLLATGRLPLRRTRRAGALAQPDPAAQAQPHLTTQSQPPPAAQARPSAATRDEARLPVPSPWGVPAPGAEQPATADPFEPVPHARLGQGSDGGVVVLVGGGPGDPGLLTVAGRQWLARADVVVTDRLAPTAVLVELDPGVEIIDVGKVAGNHPIPQHEINRLLVERAQRGEVVVRLKGGDPFVLGRGGEEALHCIEHGVAVEVVPGVTSAVSVAAAAGIPVTHRGITTSFVVASAHAGAGSAQRAAANAPDDATLVLLMGLSALATTAAELVAAGRPTDTPVAVVSRGWSPDQRTVVGTLATIADDVRAVELPGPAIVVVGEVVRLREQLLPLDRTTRQP